MLQHLQQRMPVEHLQLPVRTAPSVQADVHVHAPLPGQQQTDVKILRPVTEHGHGLKIPQDLYSIAQPMKPSFAVTHLLSERQLLMMHVLVRQPLLKQAQTPQLILTALQLIADIGKQLMDAAMLQIAPSASQ
jgi:hypothetical protein